jgi:hypothetical protein
MPLSDAERRRIETFSEQIAKSIRGPDLSRLALASTALPQIKARDFALAANSIERLREQALAPSRELSRIAEAITNPNFTVALPSVKTLSDQYAQAFPRIRELAIDAAKLPNVELLTSAIAAQALSSQMALPKNFAELAKSHPVFEDPRSWARASTLVTEGLFPNRDRSDALIRNVTALTVEPEAVATVAAAALELNPDDVDGLAAVWLVVSDMSPAERRNLRVAVGGLIVAVYMYVVALSTDEELATALGKTLLVFVGLYGVYSAFLAGIESYRDDGADETP